jgi:MFS family permease
MDPSRLVRFASVGAAAMMVLHSVASGFLLLFPVRFGLMFCCAGLDPTVQTWLAKATPEKRRGIVFGWGGSARAIGWATAPLASGAVAAALGIRQVYMFGAALFLLLIPLLALVVSRQGRP